MSRDPFAGAHPENGGDPGAAARDDHRHTGNEDHRLGNVLPSVMAPAPRRSEDRGGSEAQGDPGCR